jgi:hypothetical protein
MGVLMEGVWRWCASTSPICAVQVQPAADRRLPKSFELHARALSGSLESRRPRRRYYVINYWSIKWSNPTGIIPKGTPFNYAQSHDRGRLAA